MARRSATAAMDYRSFKVRAKSIDETNRTIDAMISTETPVAEWDWQRGEMVPRILVAEGAVLPKSRQVPLLDSHNRYSLDSQLGSIRNLTREANGISGQLNFSSTAADAWTKVREGHVTDVSAGFEVLKENYLSAGESRTFFGKTYTGPVNVATKWRLHEGSTVPIGADEAAKMRGFRIDAGKLVKSMPSAVDGSTNEEFRMNAELKKLCVERGMDEKLSDADAQAWLVANAAKVFAPPAGASRTLPDSVKDGVILDAKINVDEIARKAAEAATNATLKQIELREQAHRDQRAAFERDCEASLKLVFGETIPADTRSLALAAGSMEQAHEVIRTAKAKADEETRVNPFGGLAIEHVAAQRDKHRAALQSALLVRSYDLRGYGLADKQLPVDKRATGWEQFRHAPLLEIARECLVADGYNYRELSGLSRQNLAIAALGWPHKVGLRGMGAYHTTGSLAYLTLDAINKNLTAGYTEAPSTWRGPMRQAASVPDFKQKHVIKMGAIGNLPIWQDNKAPIEAAVANEKESYAVEARAETIGFSWQLFVNDDMDALSRSPSLLGAAAARTVNAVAWAQVTGNPTLSDGQALFLENATGNRKRSNLTTGSASPSNTTIGAMRAKMRKMRGLNTPEGNESQDILNIQPVYLVGPASLEEIILKQVNSGADPASGGNSNVYNSSRVLMPVIEPLLDDASTTAWYLFASPSQVDTVEVTFLQGQETPVINDYVDEATWSRKVTVVQSFAAKAIDHRGVQKHAGA